MERQRIVVADDHPLFRDALGLAVVEALPAAEVVEAGSLEGVEAALAAAPDTDLVMLDLNMPGMHGFSGLVFLRAQFPSTPVAVISANEEAAVVRRAIEFGAAGYITKSAAPEEIRAALLAMLGGEMWLPPGIELGGEAAGADAALAAQLARLTPQQVRVLMMLTEGLPNKQIAHALGVSEGTVKAHVSAILQKLQVDSRTQAVILAGRLGADANTPQEQILRAAAEAKPPT
jgi:DNA-binding NarL/FixJ family response regulator